MKLLVIPMVIQKVPARAPFEPKFSDPKFNKHETCRYKEQVDSKRTNETNRAV